jgi:hypothetical protein
MNHFRSLLLIALPLTLVGCGAISEDGFGSSRFGKLIQGSLGLAQLVGLGVVLGLVARHLFGNRKPRRKTDDQRRTAERLGDKSESAPQQGNTPSDSA